MYGYKKQKVKIYRPVAVVLCAVFATACLSPQLLAQSQSRQSPDRSATSSQNDNTYRQISIEPDWAAVDNALQAGQLERADRLTAKTMDTRQGAMFREKMDVWREPSEDTNVVILFPLLAFSADQSSFVAGKTFYSFTADIEYSRHVNVVGVCSGIAPPADSALARKVRKERATRPTLERLALPYVISHEEYGHTLNFSGFGCGYEITLICKAECEPESELIAIANDLFVFNPR